MSGLACDNPVGRGPFGWSSDLFAGPAQSGRRKPTG
jgi:hypothetical protein